MHRLIMDAPKGKYVDHRNHDTLDNRRANLRITTSSGNMMNRRGANVNSETGIRGVYVHRVYNKAYDWHGTYYNARIMKDGKSKTKNFPFTDEGKEAARVWVEAARAEAEAAVY